MVLGRELTQEKRNMSEVATSPRLEGEAATVEGRLADLMEEAGEVRIDGYQLSDSDRMLVVTALREAEQLWARRHALGQAAS